MSLAELVQSSGWKNFIAKLYGIGASVVILGALFKIQHWPLANFMLTLGLCTEAVIFFFSAFEPLHEEVDWSLVYPELAGMPEEGDELPSHGRYHGAVGGGGGGVGSVALAKFDEMLEKAEISPELFQKLGVGMTKLSESTANINVMGDISAASAKYMNSVNNATDSLEKFR
jgi:gliding motility-associated protein GldL